MHVAVEYFHICVRLNLRGRYLAGAFHNDAGSVNAFARHLEGHLLEVENDIRRVFHYPGNGAEFVGNAVNAHGRDGAAFD